MASTEGSTVEKAGPAGTRSERPRGERTFVERLNNYFVYRTIRKAIRDCGAAGPILIAPCGYGWHFRLYRKDGIEFVGVDISPEALAAARKAVTPPPSVREADILHLPFTDGQFEFVVNSRFLLHFEDDFRARAFKEIARVAGRYVLVHYDRMSLRLRLRKLRGVAKPPLEEDKLQGWQKNKRRARRLVYDKKRMVAEGAAAGLTVKKLYYVSRLFSDRVYCLYEKTEK